MLRLELDCLKQSSLEIPFSKRRITMRAGTQVSADRALLDVLFPRVRAEILRLLLSTPPKQYYVRELARMTGLALCTIQDELRKLSAVGIIVSSTRPQRRFYKANTDHPLFHELIRMVNLSERLPRTKHSVLYRKRKSSGRTKVARSKNIKLPPNRALNWRLFSRKKLTA